MRNIGVDLIRGLLLNRPQAGGLIERDLGLKLKEKVCSVAEVGKRWIPRITAQGASSS